MTSEKNDDVKKEGWEREAIEKLLFSTLKEQRVRRRWNIFLRLLSLSVFGFVFWFFFMSGGSDKVSHGRHVAIVKIDGAISSSKNSASKMIIPSLRNAFESRESVGVILRVNSPGGSPVQAGMIYDEIKRLREKYPKKPIYTVVEEMCASGAYYVAAATDDIFVDKASLVGSIGVRMSGFGFTGLMEQLGIERRLLIAGKNKGLMDPYSTQDPEQKAHLQSIIDEIHQQFIAVVKEGRGDRLKEAEDMFSGLVWTGSQAIELGLVDGYGTLDSVAKQKLKTKKMVNYTIETELHERILKQLGASVGLGAAKFVWESAGGEME